MGGKTKQNSNGYEFSFRYIEVAFTPRDSQGAPYLVCIYAPEYCKNPETKKQTLKEQHLSKLVGEGEEGR